jgi:hypothetical protein
MSSMLKAKVCWLFDNCKDSYLKIAETPQDAGAESGLYFRNSPLVVVGGVIGIMDRDNR